MIYGGHKCVSPSEKIGYIVYHDYNVGCQHLKQWHLYYNREMRQHLASNLQT